MAVGCAGLDSLLIGFYSRTRRHSAASGIAELTINGGELIELTKRNRTEEYEWPCGHSSQPASTVDASRESDVAGAMPPRTAGGRSSASRPKERSVSTARAVSSEVSSAKWEVFRSRPTSYCFPLN